MHQFRDKSAAPARAGLRGAALLPGAAWPPTCSPTAPHEVPGRRGPARAPRADARRRAALQRALRRGHPRRARAPHPRGRRADHGPAGARAARCRRPAAPPRAPSSCSTSPATIEQEVQARGDRLRQRDRARAPTSPGVTNLIDILAVARGMTPEAVEAELRSARGYGDLKAATAAGRRRDAGARARALRRAARRRGAAGGDPRRRAPRRRARWPRETLADVRAAMGFGPRELAARAPAQPARRRHRPRRHDVLRGDHAAAAATSVDELASARTAPACSPAPTPPGTLIGALPAGWLAARVGRQGDGARRA